MIHVIWSFRYQNKFYSGQKCKTYRSTHNVNIKRKLFGASPLLVQAMGPGCKPCQQQQSFSHSCWKFGRLQISTVFLTFKLMLTGTTASSKFLTLEGSHSGDSAPASPCLYKNMASKCVYDSLQYLSVALILASSLPLSRSPLLTLSGAMPSVMLAALFLNLSLASACYEYPLCCCPV